MSISRLAHRFKNARQAVVFTGAGISTDSGIPDFRSPKGLWSQTKPVLYQEFLSSEEARLRHWRFLLGAWKEFRDAQPNAGHRALVRLEEVGRLSSVVTQNIDGLHQAAGHAEDRVIELHGNARSVECCSCGDLTEPQPHFNAFDETGRPPLCECGGFLKLATVSFGQPMPLDKMEAAVRAARNCDLMLAVGSTLEVQPAASVPLEAQRSGAFYAIVNRGDTDHDEIADLRLEGDASSLLSELAQLVAD